jgi:hypothetical protein
MTRPAELPILPHVFPAPPCKKALVRTGKSRGGTSDPERVFQDFPAPYTISTCPDKRSSMQVNAASMCQASSIFLDINPIVVKSLPKLLCNMAYSGINFRSHDIFPPECRHLPG